jgi:hypothetical protein
MTASHWWKKRNDVIVTCRERAVSTASVYRARDGSMLVCLLLQRDIDHLGLLLFRFNAFSVRLR